MWPNKKDRFAEFFNSYQAMVRQVIFNMCGERNVDDLTQDVFLKAWQGMNLFSGRSKVKTWLYRITINVSIDYLRQNRAEYLPGDNQNILENIESSKIGIDIQLSHRQLIQAGLLKLSPDHRAVVILGCFEGRTNTEMAEIIGHSEGTIKSRLFYARKQLEEYFAKAGVNYE